MIYILSKRALSLLKKIPYSDKYLLYKKNCNTLLFHCYCAIVVFIYLYCYFWFSILCVFVFGSFALGCFLSCRMSSNRLALDDITEAVTKDSDEEFPFESDEENEINVFHGSYPKVTDCARQRCVTRCSVIANCELCQLAEVMFLFFLQTTSTAVSTLQTPASLQAALKHLVCSYVFIANQL